MNELEVLKNEVFVNDSGVHEYISIISSINGVDSIYRIKDKIVFNDDVYNDLRVVSTFNNVHNNSQVVSVVSAFKIEIITSNDNVIASYSTDNYNLSVQATEVLRDFFLNRLNK